MGEPAFDTHHFTKQLIEAGVPQELAEAHLNAIRDALKPITEKSLNKLDSTDYENIYLQVRNRGGKWLLAILAFLGIASFYGSYQAVKRGVDKYINTESFKSEVLSSTLSRLTAIDEKIVQTEKSARDIQKHIGAISDLPLTVTKNGFVVVDKSGETLYVETGTVKSGDAVVFQSPFKSRPIFLIQQSASTLVAQGKNATSYSQYRTQKQIAQYEYGLNGQPDLFAFLHDGRSGIQVRKERTSHTYEWIAIGK